MSSGRTGERPRLLHTPVAATVTVRAGSRGSRRFFGAPTLRALLEDRDAARAESAQLREAMASRAVIEQAKGIVVAWSGCPPDAAFDRLVSASQISNVKLRQLAGSLVDLAADPDPARDGAGAALLRLLGLPDRVARGQVASRRRAATRTPEQA